LSDLQLLLLGLGLLVILALWLVLYVWPPRESAQSRATSAAPSSSSSSSKRASWKTVAAVRQPPETQIKFKSAQTPTAKQFWPDSEDWPFVAINPVITPPEQILYRRLLEALPECMVLAQVQLSRVLGVQDGHPFHVWNNRISRMSLDFVVCRWNGRLVAVIELDDRSHERADRIEADAKKDAALAAAGVPIIRWKVHAMPDHAQIRHAIRACGMEM
jgi:hypothetical protein